jgi:hypothetical protein
MRPICPPERLRVVVAVFCVLVVGCQQADQSLPFELADGEGASLTIGPNGGLVSLPPSFSLDFPAGSLPSPVSVAVTRLIAAPFPSDAGAPVPGTSYDVDVPPGTVEIAVDAELLEVGDEVRLVVAVLGEDGEVSTYIGTYDVTNGMLAADIDVIGDISAVVSVDAIPVAFGPPDALGGGSVPAPSSPAPSGASPTSHGGVEFTATCAPDARQCYSSGLIRLWADEVVRERMGDRLFLLDPTVAASLDFISFDAEGVPTELVGIVSVGGDLRARFNSYVTSYVLEESVTTGPSVSAQPTNLQVSGNLMIVEQTTTSGGSVAFDEEFEFGITGIGTSEMLVIRVDVELDFNNADGSVTTGLVIAHVRLRR